ncbi:MAG: hypothetical protein IJQ50_07555, partial [Clostridia bacterium]|nr:hypothetical protein [Clostridia bacterium]
MKEAKKTNIKKIILVAVIIAVIAVLVIFIYNKFVSKSIYSGDGLYYSLMYKGYFLLFIRDNYFKLAYCPMDDPTAEKRELNDNVEI